MHEDNEHVTWFRELLTREGYSPTTVLQYGNAVRRWLNWPDPINDAQGFVDHLVERGAAPPTIHYVWIAVSRFCKMGGMERLQMTEIPPVRLPRSRNRPSRGVLSRAEIAAVEKALPIRGQSYIQQRLRVMFYVLYTTGLRFGEATSLQWRDVDLDGRRFLIRAQKSGRGEFRPIILDALAEELDTLERFGIRPWVFSKRTGGQPSGESISRQLRRLIHGVAPGRCVHSLRHSFITHLIEEGVPVAVVQRLARHANLATTANYIHLTDLQAEQELRRAHPFNKKG